MLVNNDSMGQLHVQSVSDSGPGLRAAPTPKYTFVILDGIYTCQFHAIVFLVYSLTKTYYAVIQLLSTCLGTAKVLSNDLDIKKQKLLAF
jgi:hypothetical protein